MTNAAQTIESGIYGEYIVDRFTLEGWNGDTQAMDSFPGYKVVIRLTAGDCPDATRRMTEINGAEWMPTYRGWFIPARSEGQLAAALAA